MQDIPKVQQCVEEVDCSCAMRAQSNMLDPNMFQKSRDKIYLIT